MTYFPMFVSLEGKPCLIVGGGRVAARKCRGLLAFGAEVTVVAKRFTAEFELHNVLLPDQDMSDRATACDCLADGCVQKITRAFHSEDVTEGKWALVVTATDSRDVNHMVAALCHARQIPVNVADCQAECTFFFPAYCMEGTVAAGITTSGQDPAMARALRRRLQTALPGWIGEIRENRKETKADE
ncbi:bifunctional precorrin-2 dehydrogenase/sirohydrochlorin ferrochelatase [Lachnospiraceae bacterium JLR.KK008]